MAHAERSAIERVEYNTIQYNLERQIETSNPERRTEASRQADKPFRTPDQLELTERRMGRQTETDRYRETYLYRYEHKETNSGKEADQQCRYLSKMVMATTFYACVVTIALKSTTGKCIIRLFINS